MIFSVRDGCFSYQKNATEEQFLLKHINLEINPGELVAILGPNGAGKTTMLRCMMGFLQWQNGDSYLNDTDIRHLSYRQLWQKIAYVPQAKGSLSAYTVEEMVLLGRSSHFGMLAQPGAEDRRIAHEAMERLGITHLAKRACSEISGGELQMVLISRALSTEPEFLILDEPESNLDFKNQLIILNAMSELTNQGLSCLFNTHYPTHALQRASKSLILDKQGNYLFGSSSKIITEKNIEAAFGVQAVIGEIETEHKIYKNVLPIQVMSMELDKKTTPVEPKEEEAREMPNELENNSQQEPQTRLAIVGIIVEDRTYAERINELLHQYDHYVVGRMGMPYEKKDVAIICVLIDAPEEVIRTISGKLSTLQGVSIKTTYSKQ